MNSVLKTGWYSCTITQAYAKDKLITICFTVDTGKYAYQHVHLKAAAYTSGLEKLANRFEEGGFIIDKNFENPYFFEQFIGLQFAVLIGRKIKGGMIANHIIELSTPEEKPEFNVLKPKSDTHFFTRQDERDAPWT